MNPYIRYSNISVEGCRRTVDAETVYPVLAALCVIRAAAVAGEYVRRPVGVCSILCDLLEGTLGDDALAYDCSYELVDRATGTNTPIKGYGAVSHWEGLPLLARIQLIDDLAAALAIIVEESSCVE